MKQKDFYYSTLYIYDKVLVDALAEDFAKSGERSKSKYLADLIAAGLAAKQRASPISAVNAEGFLERLSALERQLSALQSSVAINQTEQAVYRMLLCNVYYLLASLVYGEAFNGECLEARLYDVPPLRQYELLKRLRRFTARARLTFIAHVHYYDVTASKRAFYGSVQKDDYLGYAEKFQRDLYRRMGNIIIKEILKKRRDELLKARELRHAKARQKFYPESLTDCIMTSMEIAAKADAEAAECFREFMEKLKLAETERQLEQMEL